MDEMNTFFLACKELPFLPVDVTSLKKFEIV